eukprot:NODE_1381_length_883_cov_99.153439_g1335_i0.p1 GENE.NODE_1381_length_883_cov_99.153439_g1335_i0~~NODE_1381_length_883_cov_99.153439_g1335_i0.p1  ORF type:complete len:182 (-),score=30.94 NODE_1381_length_883_cov_99.153439_g1335_i0:229-774(-)
MPPKKDDKKLSKKEKKRLKQLELAAQKAEEERQQQREDLFTEEGQERTKITYEERLALAEMKLQKNREWAQFLVERRAHNQLQQRYKDLSRASASEKSVMDKGIATMTRTKEGLETEFTQLQVDCKSQADDLAQQRKMLESEMSERGNCFVCPDCAKSIMPKIRKQGLAANLLTRSKRTTG